MGFMSANNNPVLNLLSSLFCKKKKRKRYKFLDETPKPARDLINKLTQPKVEATHTNIRKTSYAKVTMNHAEFFLSILFCALILFGCSYLLLQLD